jgi:hypothetical protein
VIWLRSTKLVTSMAFRQSVVSSNAEEEPASDYLSAHASELDILVLATLAAPEEFYPLLGICEAALSPVSFGSPEHKEMNYYPKPF